MTDRLAGTGRAWPAFPFLLAAASLPAQGVLRFDMGTSTSPVASGYTAITPTTSYSAALGHGWTAGGPTSFTQAALPSSIPLVGDAALLRDGVDGYGDLTFRVDVPNGSYQVVVWLGNLGSSLAPTPRDNLDLTVNGVPVATDLAVRTLTMKAQYLNAIGGYRRVVGVVSNTIGRLDVTFHCDGAGNSKNSILGIEIWPDVPAPIRFDHATNGLFAAAPYAAVLAPALAAFNVGDYAAARGAFDVLADARLRAWGYAWLLGWLTGDEDEIDDALLANAQVLLQGLAAPDDITVAGLWWELEAMKQADFWNRARGYTVGAWPGGLGSILANLNAAILLFEQFRSDVLRPAPIAWMPPSPLHVKAHYLTARNMWGRNTGVNDPVSNPYTAQWLSMLTTIWNRQALFPKGDEAKVMGFLGSAYAMPGGIVQNWTGPASLPPIAPANAWWAPFVTMNDHPAAPAWANAMRRYHRMFRNCSEWWMSRRLVDGEIGGGDGDDVEGAGLLALPAVAVREPGHPVEVGAEEVMDKVLFGPSMTVAEGYFTGCGDVEHSAEFSTNPLYILLAASYGSPKYTEYALRTLRNLDDAFDPVPWTQLDGLGGRHFRGYNLGANVVCGPLLDIPLCMRAAVPGFAIGDFNAHPGVVQVFDQLARAWASNASSTAQNKPRGVFPAAVTTSPPYVFGTNGNWWENAGYVDLEGGPIYHAYLYALLQSAYVRSTAADRYLLLRPILLGGTFLHGYLTGTVTGTAPGTGGWAANLLKNVIADAVARARGSMLAEPLLAITPATQAQLDAVINAYASPFEKHVALPVVGTKPKTSFVTTFQNAQVWATWFWPLATSTVSYTDRIYIMTGGSQTSLFGCLTGASTWGILPPSVLSWVDPDPAAGELDFAALVNDIQATGLDVLLFHYGAGPRDFGLRLWRSLPTGQYEARIGVDANQDDTMDGPPHTVVPFVLTNPGVTVTLPNVPNGALQKIEIRQVAPGGGASPLLPDAAIERDDIVVGLGGSLAVTVHNLGSAPLVGAVCELRQNNVVVASVAVPTIGAPLDYQPKTAVVNLCCGALSPGASLTVALVLPPGNQQITPENDVVTFAPPAVVTIGPGCAGANGTLTQTHTSLPVIGSTYTVAIGNLAGGLAYQAVGLEPLVVPLAPLGFGFGPTCAGHLDPLVFEFLPQAGGTATWSFVIPPAPHLAGASLLTQALELGTPSAVSNALQAWLQ